MTQKVWTVRASGAARTGAGGRRCRGNSDVLWCFGQLLLTCCAAVGAAEVKTVRCGDDVRLGCNGGTDTPYLEVAWYKANKEMRRVIIRTTGSSGNSKPFVAQRVPPPSFGEAHGLLMPGATPEDAGTYECAVTAKIGYKNHKHRVNLTVEPCPTEAPLVVNAASTICARRTHALPTMWTIIGYLVVGVTKVALSFVCILVCRGIYAKCGGQRRRKGRSST